MFLCLFERPPLLASDEASPARTFLAEGNITQALAALKIAKDTASGSALELLSQLLCGPEKRLTAAAALKHTWLTF